ncbi:MAG: hypothetical protein OXH71_06495 [Candidatus Dadabacteria bacterium]|nr:hypothetical protein [Candidatus Dadabacteria bacterium]
MLYKPIRVIVPELNGVSCIGEDICTDNPLRYEEAIALYEEAYEFVNSSVGIVEKKPRVIFCASQACFQSFGFSKAAAGTVDTSGIVIGPRGWKNYYIRHEMIHHLQAERLDVLKQWRSPLGSRREWLTRSAKIPGQIFPRFSRSTVWNLRNGIDQWAKKLCGKKRESYNNA